jgi:CheY-like chemotaxis protein
MDTSVRILIAEDHLVNRKVLLAFLRQLGLTADVVEDGFGVIEAVTASDYDVVLMDIRMPGLDGVEATGRIRALGDEINQPYVIAVTASAMRDDHERFREAGIDSMLTKPITIAQLAEILDDIPAAA